MSTHPAPAGSYPVTQRAFGLAIVVLGGLQLMVVLDGTVANLALARLQADLGLSDAGRNWVVVSYALAFGGLMLLGGRIGDAFGRKRVFIAGVALFTLASLLCGLAVNEVTLILARALQGTGAAIASPTALALVATTFAPGPARNQAIAIYAAMTGIGSITGLIVGGALTEVSWRWIFLINVPIGLLIVVLAVFALKETVGKRLALDVRGAVLGTFGATSLVFGISEGPELGWRSVPVITTLVLALVLLTGFLVVERRATNPLLPFKLFADRDRVVTFAAIFFSGAALFCTTVYVALFVQDILGYSPLRAGLAFIPFAVGLGVGSALASKIVMRDRAPLAGRDRCVHHGRRPVLRLDARRHRGLPDELVRSDHRHRIRCRPRGGAAAAVRGGGGRGDRDRAADRDHSGGADAVRPARVGGRRGDGDVEDALARRQRWTGRQDERPRAERAEFGLHVRARVVRGMRRTGRHRRALHPLHLA